MREQGLGGQEENGQVENEFAFAEAVRNHEHDRRRAPQDVGRLRLDPVDDVVHRVIDRDDRPLKETELPLQAPQQAQVLLHAEARVRLVARHHRQPLERAVPVTTETA